MCSTPLLSGQVCDYLLAKLVIFCFFAPLAVFQLLCYTDKKYLAARYFTLAIAFEFAALIIALLYFLLVVMMIVEIVCSILMCACCCLVIPLADRAMNRGVFPNMRNPDCVSTITMLVCFNELIFILFIHDNTTTAQVFPEETRQVAVQNEERFDEFRTNIFALATVSRHAIAMV